MSDTSVKGNFHSFHRASELAEIPSIVALDGVFFRAVLVRNSNEVNFFQVGFVQHLLDRVVEFVFHVRRAGGNVVRCYKGKSTVTIGASTTPTTNGMLQKS